MNRKDSKPDCSDALADLLKHAGLASTTLAVGLFDETGRVLEFNTGMRRLLGEPGRGDDCAARFANPCFAALWQLGAEDLGFRGHLSIGDGKRVNRSIVAQARRRDDCLEVVGDIDAVELDRNLNDLVELNRTITNLERELLRKHRWLEASLETITRKERLNAALAEVNEAIRTHDDEQDLYRALCEISVRCGRFKLACVSSPDETQVFQFLAVAGETPFLDGLRILLDPESPEGQGPSARAYRSGIEQVSSVFDQDQTTASWQERARRHGVAASASIPIRGGAGPLSVLSVYADMPGFFGDDELQLLLKIATDVGFAVDALRQRRALRRSEERFRLAVDAATIGVWEYHPDCHRLFWDGRMDQLHGCALDRAPTDFAGWRRFVHPEDRVAIARRLYGAVRAKTKLSQVMRVIWPNGETHWLQLIARVLPGSMGEPPAITGVCFDVTEQQRADEQIRQLAFYDPLTHLANRRLLLDRLQHAFVRAERQGSHGALLLLDLDGFKRVNDTQGHDVGDELLVELANRLRGELRRVDTIARLGGDEFVVLGEGLDAAIEVATQEANVLALKVATLARRPYALPSAEGSLLHCAASVGIALFDGRSSSPGEAMKQADIAMFESKRAGRNTTRTFQPAMQSALEHQAKRVELLQNALDNDQLRLCYQPQLDGQGRWFGCEVMLDWKQDQDRGESLIDLLDAADEAGDRMQALDDWVLEQVMDQQSRLCTACNGRLWIGIPISAQKFFDPTFVEKTLALIEQATFDRCALRIEIKEHALFANLARSAQTMTRLQAAGVGVGVGMRDVYRGFSALPLAKRLPLQTVKIGTEVVRCCVSDLSAKALVRAAIAIGRALDVPVIAEGIENKDQHETLITEGCALFQGDYLEPRMSVETFAQRVANVELIRN